MKKKNLLIVAFSVLAISLFAKSNDIKPTKDVLDKVLDSVVPLESSYNGSVGYNGDYVLFGIWPQSKKANNVSVDTSNANFINGWNCYKGSDDCFYVKTKTKPYDEYKFDDGSDIEASKDYFFLLEPLVWRVVDNNYESGKLLVSEKILSSGSFCTSTNDRKDALNNYEKSSIRAWLNGLNGNSYDVENFTGKGFINKAFSDNGINNIKTVNVDNSASSTGYSGSDLKKVKKYACKNTNDKIFLLSGSEVTNDKYGFGSTKENDLSRTRKTTDYARATVAYSNSDTKYMNNGWWWLRSPNSRMDNVALGVRYDGVSNANYTISHDRKAGGIVPSLVIK